MRLGLFFHTAALFVAAQIVALVVAHDLFALRFPAYPNGGMPLAHFLLLFFGFTLFLFALFHFYRGRIVYRAVFTAILFVGLFKLFEIVFPASLGAAAAALFVTSLYLLPYVWVHNLVVILASAGIGALFGAQFTWETAAWILFILSVYDFFAVLVTRHMVTLEHEMTSEQANFALIVPEQWRDMRLGTERVQPGSGFLILGGGDAIVPMFFVTSLYAVSTPAAVAAIVGMIFGLLGNHVWLLRKRKPLPALPFIAFGAVLGGMIGLLI